MQAVSNGQRQPGCQPLLNDQVARARSRESRSERHNEISGDRGDRVGHADGRAVSGDLVAAGRLLRHRCEPCRPYNALDEWIADVVVDTVDHGLRPGAASARVRKALIK